MNDPSRMVSPIETYREGLRAGRLRYQRCETCTSAVFFPRVVCPHCGSDRLDWLDSEGTGRIYSTTTTRSRSGDYNVSLIDLDEGFRMMCTVSDEIEHEPRIGERVSAVVPKGTTAETLVFSRSRA